MSWYTKSAPNDDIVVSCRIRLARNIKGMPFPSKMNSKQLEALNETVKSALFKSNLPIVKQLKYIRMDNIPELERLAMVERHIISRNFASNCKNRAIIISDDEEICIMLGEEDHIRIQVLLSGLRLQEAYDKASAIDDILCKNLDIAFDRRLGFLTECPTNLGTGLRASVMMHLPVVKSNYEKELLDFVSDIGGTIRGIYGEGSKIQGSLYQLSNQITLGIQETTTVNNLESLALSIIDKEKGYRKKLDMLQTEDICMRSLGILRSARILQSDEMTDRLGDIKLGQSLGVLKCNESPIKLMIECRPNMLMRRLGVLSPNERDIERAKLIRESI